MTEAERTLEIAGEVAAVLDDHGAPSAIIGAVAMAVRGYPRATGDLDMATVIEPFKSLAAVGDTLRARGFDVELALPDHEDPLGGVLTIRAAGADPVQVVNYLNPWNGWVPVGKEAIDTAEPRLLPSLRVVDAPHLVALKLYAGGAKSRLDVLELLDRQPQSIVEETKVLCERLGFGPELAALLAGR
jgi:hypothetical protein